MKNIFEHSNSSWVRYSDYEWRKASDGYHYLLPTSDAVPEIYDPMKDAETLVLTAMNIGLMLIRRQPDGKVRDAIRDFALKYGLLGIMTALPTTVKFIEYEKVYFPKNELIRTESMETEDYLKLFFPFHNPDFVKSGMESTWNITDQTLIPLVLAWQKDPQSVAMSFMREYGERYDWLAAIFRDWAFVYLTTVFYYQDKDTLDEETLMIYRKGMAAFDGNAPTYRIELRDKPTLVWDFHSLMLCVKMLFSFMLTDDTQPLKLCKGCGKLFVAKKAGAEYCSRKCRDES